MADANTQSDQQHPLWQRDRQIVDSLLAGEPTDYNVAELARLRMRYQDFPGARDIQRDLAALMQRWNFTEASLHARTREIHAQRPVYRVRGTRQEDWS